MHEFTQAVINKIKEKDITFGGKRSTFFPIRLIELTDIIMAPFNPYYSTTAFDEKAELMVKSRCKTTFEEAIKVVSIVKDEGFRNDLIRTLFELHQLDVERSKSIHEFVRETLFTKVDLLEKKLKTIKEVLDEE